VWRRKSNYLKNKFNFIKVLNNSTNYWQSGNKSKKESEGNQVGYLYKLREPLIIKNNAIFTLSVNNLKFKIINKCLGIPEWKKNN